MKREALIILAAGLLLGGCKPRETKVTGQVFIATAGGVTFRLGAVEVQLIEKEQVTEYLNQTRALLESNRVSYRAELDSAQADLLKAQESAKADLVKAQDEYNRWLTNRPDLSRSAFDETLRKGVDAWRTNNAPLQAAANAAVQALVARSQAMSGRSQRGSTRSSYDAATAAYAIRAAADSRAATAQYDSLEWLARRLFEPQTIAGVRSQYSQVPVITGVRVQELVAWETFLLRAQEGLQRIEKSTLKKMNEMSGRESTIKLDEAKIEYERKLQPFQTRVAAAKSKLEEPVTPETLLDAFRPIPVQKVTTDAEGNFFLTYPRSKDPRSKAFMIFAKAQRAAMAETPEKYYWLIDAPSKTESTRVLLNNNNLVEVDPDGNLQFERKAERSSRSQ